jgi:antitoxin component YwqK of YwqJK toxin-antitoxin module
MLQGMAMGGSLAGPYGAGGGLIIGLLAGLFTADAHYAQRNTQIQSEQAKDRELEAKIEQEMERQRELEAQLVNSAGNAAQQNQAEPSQSVQKVTAPKITTVAMKEASSAVVSLTKKESPANSPTSPFKNVEVRDINGDGVPDLWVYYSPLKLTEIVRQEEATHGDGRVDTWSYFNDGKLVRREVDTKGKGRADTVYYYDNDKIAREDRDENGSGHVSFRALYQNGRLAKVEKDTSGGGKIDLWIYYDTRKDGEVVLKEERDLTGDGVLDLWSYYENGRLVRRDLSAVGLELLSKQDQLPSSPADPKQTFRPQVAKDDKGHS